MSSSIIFSGPHKYDEDNIHRAMRGELPPCKEDSINYPMHQFFCNLKDDRLAINFKDLGLTRRDGILPPSAYGYDSWWWYDFENHKHRHALAWLTAGWYVDDLSCVHEKVTFVRFNLPKTIKK